MSRWLPAALILVMVACSGSRPEPTVAPTPTLQPRQTATVTPTAVAQAVGTPLATVGPTPTPVTHVVESGDTLLGIATKYGVELAELLLANPGINPRLLSIGAEVVVPISGAQGPVATATPVPLQLSSPRCYPEIEGGVWCLLLAVSGGSQPVEAVVALVTLSAPNGQPIVTEPAYSPLNLLTPGSSLLLAAYFEPPVPGYASASAVLASALLAGEVESRYPPVMLQLGTPTIQPDGLAASISVAARLADSDRKAEAGLRVLAVALDAGGAPIGYRVWETAQIDLLTVGIAFELFVPSLGPPIDELLVLAEAR